MPLNTEQINIDDTYEVILLVRREGNYKKCYLFIYYETYVTDII
jgi:hypothetical protein